MDTIWEVKIDGNKKFLKIGSDEKKCTIVAEPNMCLSDEVADFIYYIGAPGAIEPHKVL